VSAAGFDVIDAAYFPMSGTTLEGAKKHALAGQGHGTQSWLRQ
jgi:hypothetical protein